MADRSPVRTPNLKKSNVKDDYEAVETNAVDENMPRVVEDQDDHDQRQEDQDEEKEYEQNQDREQDRKQESEQYKENSKKTSRQIDNGNESVAVMINSSSIQNNNNNKNNNNNGSSLAVSPISSNAAITTTKTTSPLPNLTPIPSRVDNYGDSMLNQRDNASTISKPSSADVRKVQFNIPNDNTDNTNAVNINNAAPTTATEEEVEREKEAVTTTHQDDEKLKTANNNNNKSLKPDLHTNRSYQKALLARYQSFSSEYEPCCYPWFYNYVLCMKWNVCPHWMYRHVCICCFWGTNERKTCAFRILYNRFYLLVYLLIIGITISLLVYDLNRRGLLSNVKAEPLVMKILDVFCVALMCFDISMQILAHPRRYWLSYTNLFDFLVVMLCVLALPVYWASPPSGIFYSVVLLIRFFAQLLRILMICAHHRRRRQFLKAARHDVVDFGPYEDSFLIDYAQGKKDRPLPIPPPSPPLTSSQSNTVNAKKEKPHKKNNSNNRQSNDALHEDRHHSHNHQNDSSKNKTQNDTALARNDSAPITI